ncbi:hypothetical protein QZH41_016492 [Actinostola sp. cb2023]|nr:hypothetical protein QZH41_016492 [Actinostola sp. cb2023]
MGVSMCSHVLHERLVLNKNIAMVIWSLTVGDDHFRFEALAFFPVKHKNCSNLFSGGAPYTAVFVRDLYKELRRGYRMEKPEMCSDQMYSIMEKCWQQKPSDRPSFTELCQTFEQMLQEENPYMEFGNLDNNKDYYLVPSFDSVPDENSESSDPST